jgi:hypothetical protein
MVPLSWHIVRDGGEKSKRLPSPVVALIPSPPDFVASLEEYAKAGLCAYRWGGGDAVRRADWPAEARSAMRLTWEPDGDWPSA